MLKVDNITVRYGGLTALRDVTLELDEGGFVALVGANGAGKSSLFKALLGTAPLAAGRVVASGAPAVVLTPELIRDVYGVDAVVLAHPVTGRPVIAYS